jgi:hypothetical protein
LTVGYTDNTAANSALGRHADIIDPIAGMPYIPQVSIAAKVLPEPVPEICTGR